MGNNSYCFRSVKNAHNHTKVMRFYSRRRICLRSFQLEKRYYGRLKISRLNMILAT